MNGSRPMMMMMMMINCHNHYFNISCFHVFKNDSDYYSRFAHTPDHDQIVIVW